MSKQYHKCCLRQIKKSKKLIMDSDKNCVPIEFVVEDSDHQPKLSRKGRASFQAAGMAPVKRVHKNTMTGSNIGDRKLESSSNEERLDMFNKASDVVDGCFNELEKCDSSLSAVCKELRRQRKTMHAFLSYIRVCKGKLTRNWNAAGKIVNEPQNTIAQRYIHENTLVRKLRGPRK